MNNELIIVGCGTIGASLSLNLARKKLISKLTIYDFDVVSFGSEKSIYPFNSCASGLSKVENIKFRCKKINPDLDIVVNEERVLKPIVTDQFIIDCRDCKTPNLNSKIRLSLDGSILYIDSRKKIPETKNYYRYYYSRNPEFIETANQIIINYLVNDEYTCNQLRVYNTETSEYHILPTEN